MKNNRKKHTRAKFLLSVLFVIVVILCFAGFIGWAIAHDETNVEAQKAWIQDAKDLDAKIQFEKEHPEVTVSE
jgi:cell division protein FtsB